MSVNVVQLIETWKEMTSFDVTTISIIRRLARKAEISRSLYVSYDDDLARSHGTDPLSHQNVSDFIFVLLSVYNQSGDLRYLNSALKIAGGVLMLPQYNSDDSVWRSLNCAVEGVSLS